MAKEERLTVGVDRLYSGAVRLPETAPWLAELKREMLGFPNLTHDDQVDSVTQFLHWMLERRGRAASDDMRNRRPAGIPRRRRATMMESPRAT